MQSETAGKRHWGLANSRIGDEPGLGGDRVDWLIDNHVAYQVLLEAIRSARQSIWISQLAFDADCRAYEMAGAEPKSGDVLIDAVLSASAANDVAVRILLNSTLLLNTKRPLLRFLTARDVDTQLVTVRGVSRFPQLLHAKMVIIDERRAFLMGSPFVNGYWDTDAHDPVDERRPLRELGGRPVHDVSVELGGRVVGDLAATFSRFWDQSEVQRADDPPHHHRGTLSAPRHQKSIRVVTTEPRRSRATSDPGSVATLDALLSGIQNAQSLVYIEHQYLSSRRVATALRAALDRSPTLEMILLLNQNPDVTAYRRWQNSRLAEMGLLEHPRVGLFGLWSAGKMGQDQSFSVNQVFVHSKVVVIDDRWAMVGSANLDGASLDSYGDDFSGWLGRRVFRHVRNFDVSVVVQAGKKSVSGTNPIGDLRARLWAEHLGNGSQPPAFDGGNAVSAWKAIALQNAAALNGLLSRKSTVAGRTFILAYSTRATPAAQLADAGVSDPSGFDLKFNPGWLEVNFSPNWIRNMLL